MTGNAFDGLIKAQNLVCSYYIPFNWPPTHNDREKENKTSQAKSSGGGKNDSS